MTITTFVRLCSTSPQHKQVILWQVARGEYSECETMLPVTQGYKKHKASNIVSNEQHNI